MKRFLFLLLPMMLVFVFAGCSKKVNTPSETNNTSQQKMEQEKQGENKTQTMEDTKTNQVKKDMSMDLATMPEVLIKTTMGDITVKLYEDLSPKTVENFIKLAKDGIYDGTRFHRVIADFMIQGGDPLSKDVTKKDFWGTGDPGYKFEDEFNNIKLVKGSLAMANSGPNTNGSQFFIVTADSTPWLDGRHTNFGIVVEGQDVVDKIGTVQTDGRDRPVEDVIINSMEVVEHK